MLAAESYSELLDGVCGVYRERRILVLKSLLITYTVELIYHRLEATKYLQIPAEPEALLQEVHNKLTPLAPDIVQQLVEELRKDREISEKEKATVTRRFKSVLKQTRRQ